MRLLLLGASLLLLQNVIGQEYVFAEKTTSINEHFVNSETLQEEAVSNRYGSLTRSEGFIIDDVTKGGALFTKKLHRTGKVIFNSDAGDYLNEIKSLLLEDYPHVNEMVNVYITENATLNAFATVNNNIYINIGLLARVENEAQLAFIISHEIMHIVDAHIINESLKVNEKASTYDKGNIGMNNDIIQLYKHEISRENETQADVDGFTLFLKQKYDIGEGRKALELLRRANDYTIDIPFKDGILFMPDTAVYVNWMKNFFEASLKKKDNEDEKEKLRTHPLIEERIDQINEMYKEVDTLQFNDTKYLVSEDKFKNIQEQAKAQITRIFSEDLDFISLFLYSSARLNEYDDVSNENLNYLGYSLQGLVIDKVKKYEAGEARSTNPSDSLFSYFYTKSTNDEFFKWSFEAIDRLNSSHDNAKIKSYYNAIVQTIVNQEIDSAKYVFGEKFSTIDFTVVKNKNGLDINDLEFNISPFADMTRKNVKTFNESVSYEGKRDGKVAVVNMNNIKIRRAQLMGLDYVVDLEKTEELDRRTDKVFENMEEDYKDQVVSMIPNPNDYNGYDYVIYDKLNQWMGERMYFNGQYYVSIHEDEINSILKDDEIQYIFSSLNIEIKSFSMKSFIAVYFSPFVLAPYLPQLAAHVGMSSTRKYQLSLAYDIETGALAFWDKRTYLEPSSTAQLNMVYNNVFNSFFND